MAEIRDDIIIDGHPEGGVHALNTTSKAMGAVEEKADQVAKKLQGFGAKVQGFFSTVGNNIAKVGKVALWTGLIGGAALATLGIVKLTRSVLQLAGASDQARAFNRTMDQVKATLASPFVHFAAQAFNILNAALRDPAVQWFVRQLALLATVILQSILPAVSALAGAITAFAHALMEGDWGNLFERTWQGFVDGWKNAGKAAGAGAGATFNEAWAEEAAKGAKASTGALRGGFLANIGDLGTGILNAMLAGFKKADLNVLNQAADAIRTRLDTLFKQGKIAEITIVPRIIGAQTAVADALKEANNAGGLNDDIIARLRERLAGLGPDVQEYVVQLLRAKDATEQVDRATADLAKKQSDLATAQKDLADAQARHAQEAAKLLPLSDDLRDLQQELAQQLIDQTADRERLVALAEEEEDAQRELARLEADQAKRLAELEPLRQAIADAAEEQYQAEQKVKQAQEDLLPLQEKLKAAQADAAKLQAEITENQRLRNEAIEDAQKAFNDQVSDLQKAIDNVGDKFKKQLDTQQKLLDAADARWKSEIDGATAAYAITKRRFDLEDSRNKKALLNFAEQRAAANLINDPNKRIAALARINRAEDQYTARNKDRLEAAQIANDLAEQTLKTTEAARDADKADALKEVERLQSLIEGDRKLLQERLATVREEGQTRLDNMRNEANEAERREAADLRAAAATVAAAQSDVDRQQGAIDLLQKDVDAARDKQERAERELAAREKTVHTETDGAIATAKTKADSARTEREALDDRLGDETRTLEQNISRKQADLDLQKSKQEEIAEKEERPLQARVDTAQSEVDASQIVLDNSQTSLDNLQTAADLANDRLTTENTITNLIDQQRQLLQTIADQQAKNDPAANGPGFGGAELAKQLAKPFTEEEIAAFKTKLETFVQTAAAFIKEKWGETDWGDLAETLWQDLDKWLKDHKIKILDYIDWGDIGNFIKDHIGEASWISAGAALGRLLLQGIKTFGGGAAAGAGGAAEGGLDAALAGAAGSAGTGALATAGFTALGLVLGALVVAGVFEGLRALGIENPAWETTRNLVKTTFEATIPSGLQEGMTSLGDANKFVLNLDGSVGAVIQTELDKLGKPHYFVFDKDGNLVQELLNPFNLSVSQLLDPKTGLVQQFTNGLSSDVTNFTFDKDGHITGQIKSPFEQAYKDVVGPTGIMPGLYTVSEEQRAAFVLAQTNKLLETVASITKPFSDAADAIVGHSIVPKMFSDILSAADTFKSSITTYGTGAGGLKDKLIEPYTLASTQIVGADTKGGIVGSLVGGITTLFDSAKTTVTAPNTGTLAQFGADATSRFDDANKLILGTGTPTDAAKAGIIKAFGEAATGVTDPTTGSLSNFGPDLVRMFGVIGVALFGDPTDERSGTGAIGKLGIGVKGAFDLIFGAETQEGTILNDLNKGKKPGGSPTGGFFPRLENMINTELDYQRTETWKGSFIEIRDTLIKFLSGEDDTGGFIGPILTKFESLGKKIGEAIAAGMRSVLQEIYNAGKELVNNAFKGADDAAGNPQSPAPRFIPTGENIGLGVGYGIGKAMSYVKRMAAGLVDAAANIIAAPSIARINVPIGSNPVTALAGSLAGASGASGGSKHLFAGVVHNHYGDPAVGYRDEEWQDMFTR